MPNVLAFFTLIIATVVTNLLGYAIVIASVLNGAAEIVNQEPMFEWSYIKDALIWLGICIVVLVISLFTYIGTRD